MNTNSVEESEFGRGYAYCLGMFLAHEWRIHEYAKMNERYPSTDMPSMWFNGAADHLFELEIPTALPEEKRAEIKEWQHKCLAFRLRMNGEKCTIDDCFLATQKAKDLLREWDNFNGIKTIKGGWE